MRLDVQGLPLLCGDIAVFKGELDKHAVAIKKMLHALESSWPISNVISMQPCWYGTADLQ